LFTTESEHVAATHAAKEMLGLRLLVKEILWQLEEQTPLYSDNQSAIALARETNILSVQNTLTFVINLFDVFLNKILLVYFTATLTQWFPKK
jgi:hypothetical protein